MGFRAIILMSYQTLMTDTKFITREGEELTTELAVQQLLRRVSELEDTCRRLQDDQNIYLERLHYMESNV
jgi:hypothetical protein